MLKLLRKIFLIVLIVMILSLGIDFAYRRVYKLSYELPKNIWIHPQIKDKYEIVKLGNSHSDDGIRFTHYNLKSLSLSSVAQSFEYDLASLKMYSQQIKEGAVIIINVSPLSFSQKKAIDEDSFQFQYYDGRISPFLIPRLKIGDYIETQVFPFLKSGFSWREKYRNEVRDRAVNAYDLKPKIEQIETKTAPSPIDTTSNLTNSQATNFGTEVSTPSGTIDDVITIRKTLTDPPMENSRLSESVQFMVGKWHSGDFGTEYFGTNKQDLEDLIRYCLENKWRPVLITIPISHALRNGLEPNYMQVYVYDNIAKTNLQGTPYFDFSINESITKKNYLFGNSDHLSASGASVFSYVLLQKLIENGYLSKETDGYSNGL